MKKRLDLQKLLAERKKADIVPVTISLEIDETNSSPVFIHNKVLVNEMDIRTGYDLIAIVKEETYLYRINDLLYVQLEQDVSRKGLYVVKTESGIEIVTKIYNEDAYLSLRIKKKENGELIYTKYLPEDFLFVFGKVIN